MRTKIIDLRGGGLKKLPVDKRDFTLAGLFGQISISDVPGNFIVKEPLIWKDQGDSDLCSAYACTEVSEDQEGMELLPEYQFFKTKVISGDPEQWGADLRSACKVGPKFGYLPKAGYEQYSGIAREQVVDPATWPAALDTVAFLQRKQSYFDATTGKYDLFDNLRSHLWQHRADNSTIVTGAMWRSLWTEAPGGVILKTQVPGESGHAFKLYGSEIINGEPYIIAQLSNGVDIGDRGRFYFPREVINREFTGFGAYMFKDIAPEVAQKLIQSGQIIGAVSPFKQAIINFLKLFKP